MLSFLLKDANTAVLVRDHVKVALMMLPRVVVVSSPYFGKEKRAQKRKE